MFAAYYRSRHGNSGGCGGGKGDRNNSDSAPVNTKKKRKKSDDDEAFEVSANKARHQAIKRKDASSSHACDSAAKAKSSTPVQVKKKSKTPDGERAFKCSAPVHVKRKSKTPDEGRAFYPNRDVASSTVASPLRRSPREAASWHVNYKEDSSVDEHFPVDEPAADNAKADGNGNKQRRGRKQNRNPKPRAWKRIIGSTIDHFNASDESTLPAPGWKIGYYFHKEKGGRERRRSAWISPIRKIPFRTNALANEFESFRKQCGGDEVNAWEEYSKSFRSRGERRGVLGAQRFDAPREEELFRKKDRDAHARLLAAGWNKKQLKHSYCDRRKCFRWYSPGCIEFARTVGATKFEELRQEFNGDEKKAWNRFVKKVGTRLCRYAIGGWRGYENAKQRAKETNER